MIKPSHDPMTEFYPNFRIFLELMAIKVREILLVSSPYDAFVIEQDGSLASRIINEYSGLNLSQPPRVTRTGSANRALEIIREKKFDLVITMPNLEDMDAFSLGNRIKRIHPDLPVILLAHSMRGVLPAEDRLKGAIDKVFIWSGNSALLLALVKNVEDRLNVAVDTETAKVRVLILVEDSPVYYSSFLPLIYKEFVTQTQAVLGEGINEEHRLLKMRARPKILLAGSYEEAEELADRYRQYLFGIISDARFPKNGKLHDEAGYAFLSRIRKEIPDLPLLLISSDPENREKAARIPAAFLDKNSPDLLSEVHEFFLTHLGFGDFVFRLPDGTEVGRADSLRDLEKKIALIPEASLWHHARRNHFSNWIMGRSEIILASRFREVPASEFDKIEDLRQYLISNINALRRWRQKGVVIQFRAETFDADIMDFVKIGDGSLGGKARGLAFMSTLLQENHWLHEKYGDISVRIPKTAVISTAGFEDFVKQNDLHEFARAGISDETVKKAFLDGKMPDWLIGDITAILDQVRWPLSVRSSSLLEDAQFQPYAGLYETYMIPNNHPDAAVRLRHLIDAVKRVYASTYFEGPKAFTRKASSTPHQEAMAVIIQELSGSEYNDYFYPAISGVAQSHNFYPVSRMAAEEGIVHIALGMGRTVMEGEKTLRFSPRHPEILPQFSTVDDILANAQRFFYALKVRNYPESLNFEHFSNLEKREVDEAETEFPVRFLSSTYSPDEHRIRDSAGRPGPKLLTFAQVLKQRLLPLPELLSDLLEMGRKGMGCAVEIEFSVNLPASSRGKGEFFFLQMRPMAGNLGGLEVEITEGEIRQALCYSKQALGNGRSCEISDIVYVKPDTFKVEDTLQIAEEIGRINADLAGGDRPYFLIGPGRWGSADRWLGIPVRWRQISGVGAIIELRNDQLRADPSQGSHFFQNITSLGIPYMTITEGTDEFIDWRRIEALGTAGETTHLRHARTETPLVLKIDGQASAGVIQWT
jgi:CheY-like chemotaxis protein